MKTQNEKEDASGRSALSVGLGFLVNGSIRFKRAIIWFLGEAKLTFEVLPLVLRGYQLRLQIFVSFLRNCYLRTLLYCVEYCRYGHTRGGYEQGPTYQVIHVNPNVEVRGGRLLARPS